MLQTIWPQNKIVLNDSKMFVTIYEYQLCNLRNEIAVIFQVTVIIV